MQLQSKIPSPCHALTPLLKKQGIKSNSQSYTFAMATRICTTWKKQRIYLPLRPYTLKVMPFGPTNASAYMQHFINHIFTPLHNKYSRYFENYIDDCSIMTGEGKDNLHQHIILEFLQILQENHLFL
jgi:hypothetical protein